MRSRWRWAVWCVLGAMAVAASAQLAAQGLPEDSKLTSTSGVTPPVERGATAATAFTISLDSVNPGANVERSACVSVAIRANLAYECGDLRLTYALPATRFWSTTRAPVMLYNSQFARPTPIVRVAVVPTGAWPGGPQSVTATLKVQKSPGATFVAYPSRTWTAAALTSSLGGAGQPSQLALSVDASDLTTNLYPIQVDITVDFGGGTTVQYATASGELAIVNRKGSEFGTGWWVAGYERLQRLANGDLFWIGGDGSTRRYTLPHTNSANVKVYSARALTGPDSLSEWPDGTFRRHLARGAYVHFAASLRHDQTVSSLGAVTRFDSQLCSFLTDVVVTPPGAQTSAEARWRFWYVGYDADDPCALYNPANPSGWYDWVNTITTGNYRSVARFFYPDSGAFVRQAAVNLPVERFAYTEQNGRIRTYRDALGTETRIGWDAASGTIVADSVVVDAANVDPTKRYIARAFRAGEAASVPQPVRAESVYTQMTGPRTDVPQITKFFIGTFGQPKRVVSALGQTTLLTYSTRFPLQATKVVAPNAFARYATYDTTTGNLLTSRADPLSYDDESPMTTYAYDPANPDNVSSVTDPAGITTTYEYAAIAAGLYPTLSAQQIGPDTAAKVRFSYCQTNQPSCFGLPRAVLSAANAQAQRSRDTLEYDANGNLSATQSADGKRTEYVNDGIGRTLTARTLLGQQAGASSLRWLTDSTWYDGFDRVTRTNRSAWGDGTTGSGSQSFAVATSYLGATGLPLSVTRSASDGIMGTLRDSTEYDPVGRVKRRFAQGVTLPESLTYDPAGNVTRRVTARGGRITSTYDALNRPSTVITSAMTYDSLRIGTATNPQIYDLTLRPSFPRLPLGRTSNRFVVDGDTASFTYDMATGQIATATNRAAQVSRTYLANGALQSETQNLRTVAGDDFTQHSYTTTYSYDPAGRRTSLRHPAQLAPGSKTETWFYNALTGQPDSVRDPMDSTVKFRFDPAGQLIRQITPNNVARQYTYTLDGEVLNDRLAPGNSTVGPPLTPLATPLDPLPRTTGPYGQYDGYIRDVNYTYDARGKLMAATNSKGLQEAMTFDYTPMGHLRRSTYASRYYDYVAGLSSTATLTMSETIRPDAMGTSTWRQTATQNYNFGGAFYSDGRYNASPERIPTYLPNTGRLARTTLCSPTMCQTLAKDTLWYDAAGNNYVQLHVDLLNQGNLGTASREATDRVMYYNAADQLVAVDARIASAPGVDDYLHSLLTFDQYRYDALGRRVFTRSQRLCASAPNGVQPGADFWFECNLGYVQRTVWDGAKELYEVRMPDQSQHWEKDGFAVGDTLGVANNNATDKNIDRDAYYGRVGYVYGGAIDKPLVMLRQDYGDRNFRAGQNPKNYRRFQPFALYPQWDLRGEPSLGTSADGGITRCEMDGSVKRCTYAMAWTQVWAPNGKQIDPLVRGWAGSLLQDKREPNGLLYRRNRYLDPATGRFTQPDPIGLAGGLNSYGFVNGDPVNYRDPFGTCKIRVGWKSALGPLKHAFIEVSSPDGSSVVFRGGPTNTKATSNLANAASMLEAMENPFNSDIPNISPGGDLLVERAPKGKDKDSGDSPTYDEPLVDDGLSCDDYLASFDATTDRIKGAHVQYWASFQNSNSAANQLLISAGFAGLRRNRAAPGWDRVLFP